MAKKRRRKDGRRFSGLEAHLRSGKVLTPPLLGIPVITHTSWIDDRLPELLWAALLITHMDRDQALGIFRRVARQCHELSPRSPKISPTQTQMAELDKSLLTQILDRIFEQPGASRILSPLALFDELPAKEVWTARIEMNQDEGHLWEALKRTVALMLDHQSQESTDCRWLRVLAMVVTGQLRIPRERSELVKEILEYPNYGDQRKVRPTIRATEIAFAIGGNGSASNWATRFWSQCLSDSPCDLKWLSTVDREMPEYGTTLPHFQNVYEELVRHCNATRVTSGIDERHDSIFGASLYCLALLLELFRPGASQSILGRMALRTLTECFVTLKYLTTTNRAENWRAYRNYGLGQAKLAFLKLTRDEFPTKYANLETLELLANEDMWMEFLPINLGNWGRMNLRTMSVTATAKDVYDRYYDWTSGFVHGHWGAVRDAILVTCANPTHRLHRVPRHLPRALEDVVADAIRIADQVLGVVDATYPTFSPRLSDKPTAT